MKVCRRVVVFGLLLFVGFCFVGCKSSSKEEKGVEILEETWDWLEEGEICRYWAWKVELRNNTDEKVAVYVEFSLFDDAGVEVLYNIAEIDLQPGETKVCSKKTMIEKTLVDKVSSGEVSELHVF